MTGSDEPRVAGRLVGIRTPYDVMPPAVQSWVAQTLGAPVVEVQPRVGGMSPAVAASVRGADGASAFVKAVSGTINPDTPQHFRHEISVLTALSTLPPVPYRAGLLATYDDGDWVAIALEDIDGRHPDWTSSADRDAVFAAVRAQTAELTPPPPRLPAESNRGAMSNYVAAMAEPSSDERAGLPAWAADELADLRSRVEGTLEHQRDESFCHWDIRHDNIVVRHRDGQPFLLDWGMSRRGQHWADTVVFAIEWVDSPDFDDIVSGIGLTAQEDDDITGFLAGLGCYVLMQATHPAPPGLPTLPAFRRQLGLACLAGVRRRLDDQPRTRIRR